MKTAVKDTITTITTHYIDGAFVESHGREVMDIISPTNRKLIGRVTLGDEEDARRAVAAARGAFSAIGRTTKDERAEGLGVAAVARAELVDAVNSIIDAARMQGRLGSLQVDEDAIAANLYTSSTPDPDLLIRTSGEMRISNFLLWQIAYSELYITDTLWPDFGRTDLLKAILDFQKRDRRFGGLNSSRSPGVDEKIGEPQLIEALGVS